MTKMTKTASPSAAAGQSLSFTDPVLNRPLKVTLVPEDKLSVASFQRRPSEMHVRHLAASISRIGFLVPLVVYPDGKKYVIIDGQHRFLAGRSVGIERFVSVIVPKDIGIKMMNLNIEKQPNIREKAYVAHRIYEELLRRTPDLPETDGRVEDGVEAPHFVTLGYAYEQKESFHGSSFEAVLLKCEAFLNDALNEAAAVRQKRANVLLETDGLLDQIIQIMKQHGIAVHPYTRRDIISHVSPVKGRGRSGEFDEVFQTIIEGLKHMIHDPQALRAVDGLEGETHG